MESWKLEDIVLGGHLFFTRLRHIVDSELDPYEGSLSPLNYENPEVNVEWMLKRIGAAWQPNEGVQALVEGIRRQYGDVNHLHWQENWARDCTYVNCWFLGEFESRQMWDSYVQHSDGVVINSTVGRLIGSFSGTAGNVFIQPVIYHDPAADSMVPPDPFHIPLYKHLNYRHEHELPCFVLAPQSNGTLTLREDGNGVWIPVDGATLINQVRVPPGAAPEALKRVEVLLAKANLSQVRVGRSALGQSKAT
jgi:hypothetical protein